MSTPVGNGVGASGEQAAGGGAVIQDRSTGTSSTPGNVQGGAAASQALAGSLGPGALGGFALPGMAPWGYPMPGMAPMMFWGGGGGPGPLVGGALGGGSGGCNPGASGGGGGTLQGGGTTAHPTALGAGSSGYASAGAPDPSIIGTFMQGWGRAGWLVGVCWGAGAAALGE